MDVDLLELVDCLVGESAVKVAESRVGHLGVVRNGDALIEVGILWFIGGLELRFTEEDPGPFGLGGAREDAGKFLQVGSDGLAECSNFFTSGHVTDSVSTGLHRETGSDGRDVWGGEIHLGCCRRSWMLYAVCLSGTDRGVLFR